MSFDQEDSDFFHEEESSFDIKTLFPKILKIWPIILGSIILFIGVAFYYTSTTAPTYLVSSKFFIKEEESALSLFDSPAAIGGQQGIGITNEIIILKSRPIAEATLIQLDFDVEYFEEGRFVKKEIFRKTPLVVEVDWEFPQLINGMVKVVWENPNEYSLVFEDDNFTQYFPDGSMAKAVPNLGGPYKFNEWVENPQFKIKINNTSNQDSGNAFYTVRNNTYLINKYSSGLIVDLEEKNSSILNLSMNVPNVDKGQTYLDALMATYLELELQEKNDIANRTINFIDKQVAGVADSLSQFENKLQSFRSNNKIYNLNNESNTVYSNLTEIETELANASLKSRYYQSLKDYLVRENYNEIIVPSGLGIEDPYLNGLIENLLAVQVDRSRLMATQTELSPSVREANKKLDDLNKSIREILDNVDLNNKMTINDLERRKAEIETSFRSLPQAEQNLIGLQRQADLSESIYNFLSEKRAESAITKASNRPNNKIIEFAKTIGGPVTPKPLRNYMIAFLIGLLLPILYVIVRELFRVRIEDISYLEKKLKIPVIATILKNKEENNLVVFNNGKSGIAESFRSLRANIRYLMQKDKQVTIMLTSTISSEGKTFCAMNLASGYSLTGKKTVLVGCDMRKPKIFDDFGIKNNIGLSTILSEQVEHWQDGVQKSGFDNLDVIVSGPIPPNPAELLSGEQFEKLVNELKQVYDVIILDTPPIGLVSETIELLNFVDLTLFVFRQDYSQRNFVTALNGLKTGKGIKNIYALFNGVDGRAVTYGYGYNYGYGYGYYSDDKVSKK
ncbi:capsular exopolysaccharide family [Algoriphagus locisalis]|uniref:non-specific protein-tyrosine kinase n=1 Tax=Algoriphagus locisalis TaxID=305507 RepID=A0A1I6XPC7_9BACT|nr:polysaccharide biosynthesis tyrosine autokinase [Algoriphagus locisalis]SFT40140.1 capsular exopolysaccharide family [Algoriphagus locisalis]